MIVLMFVFAIACIAVTEAAEAKKVKMVFDLLSKNELR